MRTWSALAKAWFGVAMVSLVGASAVAGCSTSDDGGPAAFDGGLVCPATAKDIGESCTVEGKACPLLYACGAFQQQGTCTCTGGKFVCKDATNTDWAKDQTPTCVPQSNPSDCPANEAQTDSKACATPGLICRFAGPKCSTGVQQDVCQCVAGVDGGLVFHCEPGTCNPTADASVDSAPPADASDAATDTGSATDAPADGG